jgi:hypothetical protein
LNATETNNRTRIEKMRASPHPEDSTDPDAEHYDEFGNREFGGVYFSTEREGQRQFFEISPGGITSPVSEAYYAQAAAAWDTYIREPRSPESRE